MPKRQRLGSATKPPWPHLSAVIIRPEVAFHQQHRLCGFLEGGHLGLMANAAVHGVAVVARGKPVEPPAAPARVAVPARLAGTQLDLVSQAKIDVLVFKVRVQGAGCHVAHAGVEPLAKGGIVVVVIHSVKGGSHSKLAKAVDAGNRAGGLLCVAKGWQQQAGKNGDDRNHHQ